MDEEDEIDVLGEFNLESLLTKNEEQISSCYDGEHQLGLHCDSSWILDSTTQPSWYENKPDPQPSSGCFNPQNSLETYDGNVWSDKEKYLLEKGLELFGRSWSRLAQYIGTKNSSEVKCYVKTMGVGWTGKSFVSTANFGIDCTDINFSELIDDMEIPASIEEVIAAVSTAQPTVIIPSSHRETNTDPYSFSSRKSKCRRKKHKISRCKKRHSETIKPKESVQVYKAEVLKDVLTNKEKDSIVLPSGEQVIRMRRHKSSLSEESDVDIDIGTDIDSSKDDFKEIHCVKEEFSINSKVDALEDPNVKSLSENCNDQNSLEVKSGSGLEMFDIENQEVLELFIDDIENEVSVFTDGFFEVSQEIPQNEKETQVFKGNLITPSGKVMTVIVDDVSSSLSTDSGYGSKAVELAGSKHMSTKQERLEAVYRLPPPTQEISLDPEIVTQEEKLLHPEFFARTYLGLNRYIKIRNHIVECWKNSKPNYVTKTTIRTGLKSCGDVNLISRVHAYLEQKGYINFGCEECHYTDKMPVSCSEEQDEHDSETVNKDNTISGDAVDPKKPVGTPAEKRQSFREKKKKLQFEDIYESEKSSENCIAKKHKVRSNTVGNVDKCAVTSNNKPCKKKISTPDCDGGYTMVHTDSGEVIVQHVESKVNKIITRGIKPIKLINCKNYSASNKAPYRVELEMSALMLVDIHSHMSPKSEVIGLLGGLYQASDRMLNITSAVPCKTILSSNVHCDMCPVSQCESSELITNKGLSVVGWYHSHPNFDPSPSDTDVETQNTLQSWFNETGKPFVGLIISPYCDNYSVSSYRCCQVKMENSGPTPYQLEVKLTYKNKREQLFITQSIEAARRTLQKIEPIRQSNAFKCLESIKYHLRKAQPKVEEERVSQILQEIRLGLKSKILNSSEIS